MAFTASKSRSQGREGWSVIFRHPARTDLSTGKPGRRVRKGLGTADEHEADRLVEQLNELLRDEGFWEPTAKSAAAARYDERVVEIFYDGLVGSALDSRTLRDEALPLPDAEDGYTSVMFLGTTGAGKTTVVRQILGTDPENERFPSTSTAKTTVAEAELVLSADDAYRAVVTFVSRDEVIDVLSENVSEAATLILRDKTDLEVQRRLLDHVSQRFRFSYILGRDRGEAEDEDEETDDDEALGVEVDAEAEERSETEALLDQCVADLRAAVADVIGGIRDAIGASVGDAEDERVVEELVEESLDAALREGEVFHSIVDRIFDEIEKRFDLLSEGEVRRSRQSWPRRWSYETKDREDFLKQLARFSGNSAAQFGRLLTPLVDGMRVSGPFCPDWASDAPALVLYDGEGLGHTPTTSSAVSTTVSRRFERVDAIVLVDNAMQPMQAAPAAAMRTIAQAGQGGKLFFLFTHVDQVKGDNLPTFDDRREHVLASVENVMKSLSEEIGPLGERILRKRLDERRYFVGGIQKTLREKSKAGARTISELIRLLSDLTEVLEPVEIGPMRPVYDRMNLSLAITEAAKSFHTRWRGLLGLEMNPHHRKEHWGRVKALTRRLAEGWQDEYANLQPLANLRDDLQLQIYLMLQQPVRWEGGQPSDDERQTITDEISHAIAQKLDALVVRRLRDEVRLGWQHAYAPYGPGSTFTRARIVADEVYDRGVPVPTVAASPDQNRFLHEVAEVVTDVATQFDLELL